MRRVSDGDSGISFLICHATCAVAPRSDRLSERTLMWGHDMSKWKISDVPRVLAFPVPGETS